MTTATEARPKEMRGIIDAVQVRAIDEESRTASFVASTENGVETVFGPQVLMMDGVDLKRYEKNPVVLDSHDRFELASIIGKAELRKVKKELIADVTFAKTERANAAWELVRDGFANAMSVGFRVRKAKLLEEGESWRYFEGPAEVVTDWELFEVSIVPVPADQDAIRRYLDESMNLRELTLAVRSLWENRNRTEDAMPEKSTAKSEERAAPEATPEKQSAPNVTELDAERRAREIAAHAQEIRTICGDRWKDIGERCIVENRSPEEVRAIVLDTLREESPPAGTPEPKAAESETETKAEDAERVTKLTAADFRRAFGA